jgi:phosphopentomutase
LSDDHPKLTLLGFVEPDFSGHQNSWEDYLAGIEKTDEYIYEIWEYINNDPYYSETTTLFITNDHGRHLDSINGGFQNHGDGCDGCRHINFFAYGPDFKKGIINIERELIDIPATVSELLQFESEYVEGEIMHELFK